jgi:hypothetical protein
MRSSVISICSFTLVNSNGSEVNLTGSPVDGPGNCTYCHGGGTAVTTPIITSSPAFGTGNTFVPGATYTISVGETGYSHFGFDLEICNKNSHTCTDGGTFVTPLTNCQFYAPAGRFPTNVTHTGRIPSSSTATFKWTAPSSGNAYMYFSVNGVDGDGTNSGDKPMHDSIMFSPVSATGISSVAENDRSLNCFPNPTTDLINLSYSLDGRSSVSIHLYDTQGKMISTLFSQTLEAGPQNYSANLPAGLTKGIYTLQLIVDDYLIMKRLVVK